jgi:hypothetical protein
MLIAFDGACFRNAKAFDDLSFVPGQNSAEAYRGPALALFADVEPIGNA